MVCILGVMRRTSVGQGVMRDLECSLLQMLAMTRFVRSHQLIKDRLRCFAFSNYLFIGIINPMGDQVWENHVLSSK